MTDLVTLDHRRPPGRRAQGHAGGGCRRQAGHRDSGLLQPPQAGPRGLLPHVPGRDLPAHAACMLQTACSVPVAQDMVVKTNTQQVQGYAGSQPGLHPAQPPARLPHLRQGRRVPAAGPDDALWPRHQPVGRTQAAQEQALPDLATRSCSTRSAAWFAGAASATWKSGKIKPAAWPL